MPQLNSLQLLESLKNDIRVLLPKVQEIKEFDESVLNQAPAEGKWSIAQIIEHLNTYNRFYIPTIEKAVRSDDRSFNPRFSPGLIGGYFTKMMQPDSDNRVKNKMKAAKNHSPVSRLDSAAVISYFEESEQELLRLLEEAKKVDLGKVRVPISISKLIKLKLGDTFGFLIAHQRRHFVQIAEVIQTLNLVASS